MTAERTVLITGTSSGIGLAAALTADRPPFRVQTSDWARDFTGAKLADLDGSAVQSLTGSWVG